MNPSPSTARVSRRGLIATSAVAPGLLAVMSSAEARGQALFRHGVASGDPLPDSVVLWTRVTPTAEATPGSGRGPRVEVGWEVARDPDFRAVVRRGKVTTGPGRDHTVKVDPGGLSPATWYYYRFICAGQVSRTGRTRTAPAVNAEPGNLRFGIVSCSNLQAGWFNAYRALADRDDLHAVLHLGDYLYEYAPGQYGYGKDNVDIRSHKPAHEMVVLADYRGRHAQYKRDTDLKDLHAKYPFIVTWDDHETTNDAWAGGAENHQPETEGDWATRKHAARRAYDEWMPVRMSGTAALDDGKQLYRRLRFGKLLELNMLDLRSYRTQQGDQTTTGDPEATITGEEQMAWLTSGLTGSSAQWKLIGNPVMIAPVDFGTLPADVVGQLNEVTGDLLPPDGVAYNVDQWDGYVADRRELYRHLRDHQVTDVVFVTGDIHSAWAAELPVDPGTYPVNDSTLGVELVCTSVTSNNLKDIVGSRDLSPVVIAAIQAANRHIKYLNFDDHGFSVLDVTSARTQMDWYITGERAERSGAATWERSFQTLAGTGKLQPVSSPVGG